MDRDQLIALAKITRLADDVRPVVQLIRAALRAKASDPSISSGGERAA